ncbi:MAG: hypothetical protein SXG53_17645 [Pseudomonadota bacterium]|nr:hypothetical protein [Pseudomonadota bacterium]
MTVQDFPGLSTASFCVQFLITPLTRRSAESVALFSEISYSGVSFGLGFAITTSPKRSLVPGSQGDYAWAASPAPISGSIRASI